MCILTLSVAFCIHACCATYAMVPSILTVPEIRSVSPRIDKINEDLPQPTGPTTAANSPFTTFRFIFFNTRSLLPQENEPSVTFRAFTMERGIFSNRALKILK